MATAREFDIELQNFADNVLPDKVGKLHRAVTLDVLRGVIFRSPVDTGRFRSNWQVSRNAPIVASIEPQQLGSKGDQGANAEPASQVFQRENENVARIEPFTRSFVQNNLPYAERLEAGHSQQAPNGIVAPTVAEARVKFGAA
jgi:hypothetical protein